MPRPELQDREQRKLHAHGLRIEWRDDDAVQVFPHGDVEGGAGVEVLGPDFFVVLDGHVEGLDMIYVAYFEK